MPPPTASTPSPVSPRGPANPPPKSSTPDVYVRHGQIFWMGNPDIGVGTVGTGESLSLSEDERDRIIREYIAKRRAEARQDRENDKRRIAAIAKDQLFEARDKLIEFKERNAGEMLRAAQENRLQQKAMKKEREEQYAARNAEIHAVAETKRQRDRDAMELRKQRQVEQMAAIHARRQRLLKARETEKVEEAVAAREHAADLMRVARIERQRAREEAQRALEKRRMDVKAARIAEEERRSMKQDISAAMLKDKEQYYQTHKYGIVRHGIVKALADVVDAKAIQTQEVVANRKVLDIERERQREERSVNAQQHYKGKKRVAEVARERLAHHVQAYKLQLKDSAARQREVIKSATRSRAAEDEEDREVYVRTVRSILKRCHRQPESEVRRNGEDIYVPTSPDELTKREIAYDYYKTKVRPLGVPSPTLGTGRTSY